MTDDPQDHTGGRSSVPPEASERRFRFSIVWFVPIVAIGIAGYLGWRGFMGRGPEITITFDTADGLTSGQTQVKNKAVPLGTVEAVTLTPDMRHVEVRVRMSARSAPMLTDHARFWVVRPRLNGASITGLETLMSGAYISMDPGEPGGQRTTEFKGLESPPGIRSDQPGNTYTLISATLGSIGQGAPVFFRDIDVGEVLGYTMPPGGEGPILVQVFIREPYDRYLRTDTRFWNVSGVQVGFGAGGLKVKLQSLQALFSGGVAFGLAQRREAQGVPAAPKNSVFRLYESQEAADNAGYRERLSLATYLTSSVSGLAVGAQVTMFGIQVGTVTSVKLDLDPKAGKARVRVGMEIQPERILDEDEIHHDAMAGMVQALVDNGLRASVDTASFLTGEAVIGLNFVKNATPAVVQAEGTTLVIPGKAGGMGGIMDSLSTVADKIAAMPLTQVGENLNNLLAHSDARINSPEVRQAIAALRDSLRSVQGLAGDARHGMHPLFERLPQMSEQLDKTLKNANVLLASYGGDTDFHRDLQHMLVQLDEAARSLRFLTDFLNRHPSALITGR
ncbi:paraquat-inducible protein B [Gluconacetobacter johannae DSM 13595]|uniref:MCE family protein n=1 Tax=Gluconacetobacter johannae TaxID=112140 RepID=A0A7W4J8Y1_9PROT|nr:MlaD family protein [Gluconacetobacter johannae]MBB2176881.1 MCE family protein [Gluconacetobacter johannae]GBQ86299.1 paraquat-inducible protein B [Gluconacetobacter johannae DSM 13595]